MQHDRHPTFSGPSPSVTSWLLGPFSCLLLQMPSQRYHALGNRTGPTDVSAASMPSFALLPPSCLLAGCRTARKGGGDRVIDRSKAGCREEAALPKKRCACQAWR